MKIGVCGHFARGKAALDGQTSKVRNYASVLGREFGEENIIEIDTSRAKTHFLRFVMDSFRAAKVCKSIVILPGEGGIRIIISLFTVLKKFYGFKFFYAVVGGWLPEYLGKRIGFAFKAAENLDGVYVETKTMVEGLNNLGFTNVSLAPVFSLREPLGTEEIKTDFSEPYPLCTFSRVTKTKGISDAVDAVVSLNKKHGRKICTLDIYGYCDKEYKAELEEKISASDGAAQYCGCLDDDKVISTLSEHFALLFPTYYEGEGFPATLLEAMMAGVPSIVSDFRYNAEIIRGGRNGFVYPLGDKEKFEAAIERLLLDRENAIEMRYSSLKEGYRYDPEFVMKDLTNAIKGVKL